MHADWRFHVSKKRGSKPPAAPKEARPWARAARRTEQTSQVRIAVLCTPEERERWQAAAYGAGTTLSDVARGAWERLAKREGV
jgi:hypothetical protein